jgi:hypothetical protein
MPVDIEYLRQHYASLSDEALEDIDPTDLVEAARACYNEELKRRNLALVDIEPDKPDMEAGTFETPETEEDWLEEATIVFSMADRMNGTAPESATTARDALDAAGIPCRLDLVELPREEPSTAPPPTHEWHLLVPGEFNQWASSVLDRDLFNEDFEATWRAHLEAVADDDLPAMNPQKVFCGLYDRIERITRVYKEEVARRK